MVKLASEFPNDNPALHCGVIWVCRTPTGPAEPDFPELIVEELEPLDAVEESSIPPPAPAASGILPIAGLSTSVLPPAPEDPFMVLVFALVDIAIGAGAPDVAALLPGLLLDGRIDAAGPELDRALRDAGIWDGAAVTASFGAVTAGWRAILRGTSEDFDACGGTMLDQWSADLLAALLLGSGGPARRAVALRSELRTRGVAAFGLAA